MATGVVGAQLFTCREHMTTLADLAETFRKVSEIGYTAIQLSGYNREMDIREMASLIADSGLIVGATHMGWDSFLNDLDTVIETHLLWNCTHTAIGSLAVEYRTAEGVKRFADELAPVAEKLAAAGLDFSYHNHNQEFERMEGDGRTWLAMLYEDIPGDVLKAELDTYWVQAGGGDPAAWITKCAGRQPLLHLKDMVIAPGREQHFAEIGEGNLNWPAILTAAEPAGVEFYLVEQDNCYGANPFDCLETSYKNLVAMGMK